MASPPPIVWAIAVPNERHGDVVVHGLASLPVTETAERLFWAATVDATSSTTRHTDRIALIGSFPLAAKYHNSWPKLTQATNVVGCCGGVCGGRASAVRTGSVTTNVDPLPTPSLCAVISPGCRTPMCRAMAQTKPRPVPFGG